MKNTATSEGNAMRVGADEEKLRVHAIQHGSRVNGPGNRSVIHTQGCSLACPGCFNPSTHPLEGGTMRTVDSLMAEILQAQVDGLTLSGGEPTEQILPAIRLFKMAREHNLSTMMFSGRTLHEIQRMPSGQELLDTLDILVDGRYDLSKPAMEGCWGSSNQRIHLLSQRHHPQELKIHAVELVITPSGKVMVSGFPTWALLSALSEGLGPSSPEPV